MEFIVEWLIFYAAVMFAMSIDNIFWIPTSPEYPKYLKWSLGKKIRYVIKDRVIAVLKHPRDIVPAVITSFILAVLL